MTYLFRAPKATSSSEPASDSTDKATKAKPAAVASSKSALKLVPEPAADDAPLKVDEGKAVRIRDEKSLKVDAI